MFANKTPWPLPELAAKTDQDRENAAYATGDYAHIDAFGKYIPAKPGVIDAVKERVWGSAERFDPNIEVQHDVLQENLAALLVLQSARLLFSEPPYITTEIEQAQARLRVLFGDHFHEQLLTAAESAAVFGTTFLRVTWDKSEVQHAFVTAVHSDQTIPRYGQFGLNKCSFVKEFDVPNKPELIRRLIETHELNFIGHGRIVWQLFEAKRSDTHLGEAIPLNTIPELAYLGMTADGRQELTEEGFVTFDTKTPGLTVVAVKNLPASVTAKGILSKLGRSDLHSIKPRLARIDKLNAQLAEEGDNCKSRFFVPSNHLNPPRYEGDNASFDFDQTLFTAAPPIDEIADDKVMKQITVVQPEIRQDAFIEMIEYVKKSAITSAGYSPSTFNIQDGVVALTATEVRLSQGASYATQQEKLKRFAGPLFEIVRKCISVDALIFPDTGVEVPEDLDIEFGDAFQPDQEAISRQNASDFASQSASIETRVRRANPDKTDTWVQEEVARIKEEIKEAQPAPAPVTPITPQTPPEAPAQAA